MNSDVSTRLQQGPGRPVVPEAERAEILEALSCVDHVVLFNSKDVVPVIRALRPDVQVKGTDDTPETIPEAARGARPRRARGGGGRPEGPLHLGAHRRSSRGRGPHDRPRRSPAARSPELKEILACPAARAISSSARTRRRSAAPAAGSSSDRGRHPGDARSTRRRALSAADRPAGPSRALTLPRAGRYGPRPMRASRGGAMIRSMTGFGAGPRRGAGEDARRRDPLGQPQVLRGEGPPAARARRARARRRRSS